MILLKSTCICFEV